MLFDFEQDHSGGPQVKNCGTGSTRTPEFGIGRPYLDKDPAHVAPIDGKEYTAHRKLKSAMRLRAKAGQRLLYRRTAASGAETTAAVKH
jgi:hypothetical protein